MKSTTALAALPILCTIFYLVLCMATKHIYKKAENMHKIGEYILEQLQSVKPETVNSSHDFIVYNNDGTKVFVDTIERSASNHGQSANDSQSFLYKVCTNPHAPYLVHTQYNIRSQFKKPVLAITVKDDKYTVILIQPN